MKGRRSQPVPCRAALIYLRLRGAATPSSATGMLLLLPRDILRHLFACHLRLRDVALIARLDFAHFMLVYSREDLWDALIDGRWLWRRPIAELPATVLLAAREHFAFDMLQRRRLARTALLGVPYCAPLYLVRVVHVLATERPVVKHDSAPDGVRAGHALNWLWHALVFHLPFLGMAQSFYAYTSLSEGQRARLHFWSRALADCTTSSVVLCSALTGWL